MNRELLDQLGLSHKEIKAYWTNSGKNEKRKELKNLICDRIKNGIEFSLRDYRIWWAVDKAYDAAFDQISPTIVRDILSKTYKDTTETINALKNWGLNVDELICESVDKHGNKVPVINVPAFFQVMVPLVKSYVTIRRAKLFNSRNQHPFFKYEPSKYTAKNRVIGEIITDIVQEISDNYGYPAIFRQALLQMLQYGTCLMFPREEWHKEEEPTDTEGGKRTVKQGLRYDMPHPTRAFWDLNHPLATVNTDSGCEFLGRWNTDRYRNLVENEAYWMTDKIAYGAYDWFGRYPQYFREIHQCTMEFPTLARIKDGAGEADRERAASIYSDGDGDKAVFKTELCMKINPSKYGLGKYDAPIWMRFVVVNDDSVIYCAPYCYCPVVYFGYDSDESRSRQSGMSLEILWAQDHFSNLFSQLLFTLKQNLTRVVFYDENQIQASLIEKIQNLGRKLLASIHFIPFDSRKARTYGTEAKSAFIPQSFPPLTTAEIMAAMNAVLSILERVLVISAQEIGQAASHEQTAEESNIIDKNTDTRVTFTGTFADDGVDGWKKQLYNAARANLDDDVVAHVDTNIPGARKALKELGFTIEEESDEASKSAQMKTPVKAKVSKLELSAFISSREGDTRINTGALATAMSQLLQVVFANPMLSSAVGPEQALRLIEQVAILAGLPRDFKLKLDKTATPEAQMQQLQEQFAPIAQQIQTQTLQIVDEKIGQPLLEGLQKTQADLQAVQAQGQDTAAAVEKLIAQMEQIFAIATQPQPAPAPPILPGLPPGVPMPNDLSAQNPVVPAGI